MMKPEIHRLSLGLCNCYLIKEEGLVLVDAGWPSKGTQFLKHLKTLSIDPKDISLILLTHGHWDHIGSINELKRLTGCKVAINKREKDWVEQALKPLPSGGSLWRKPLEAIISLYVSSVSFPGTSVDIMLEDKEFSLESYGVHGKVFHTPGHTSGSVSLLLDTGDAFVGDLAMNGLPLRIGPGMSVWAEDITASKESCRLLLTKGAKRIYPAHWKHFKVEALEKSL